MHPMNSSLVILADRGNVKSFRVEKAPGKRNARLRLTREITIEDAHLRTSDRLSDQAGAFPTNKNKGIDPGNSIGDRHLELEVDRRIFRQLGEHITTIVREENPMAWAFAAAGEINPAILQEVDAGLRERISENLPRNLVKTKTEDLPGYFDSVPGS